MGRLTFEAIQRLPKTDLHVHLDGSLRIATILDLARKDNVKLPASDPEGLARAMHCGENTGSLVKYLEAFDVTLMVLQTQESLFRAAYELAQDAAAENVRYMEVRYAPLLHTRKGLSHTRVVEAVLDGLRAAQVDHGITSNVIVCGIRNISPESSLEMAELAVAYKGRGVTGFDLAGAEYDHPAKKHKDSFALIRKNNINITIHAGEAYGPESIEQAIHVCGAHRIDHRIALECCPSSNVQTGAVKDLATHPLKLYHDLGLRVTVNTDNRLITDTSVSKELWLAHTKMGLTLQDLKQIVLNGFKAAFLPYHERRGMLRAIAKELADFEHEEQNGSVRPPALDGADDNARDSLGSA
jgi:adenosine deaminase